MTTLRRLGSGRNFGGSDSNVARPIMTAFCLPAPLSETGVISRGLPAQTTTTKRTCFRRFRQSFEGIHVLPGPKSATNRCSRYFLSLESRPREPATIPDAVGRSGGNNNRTAPHLVVVRSPRGIFTPLCQVLSIVFVKTRSSTLSRLFPPMCRCTSKPTSFFRTIIIFVATPSTRSNGNGCRSLENRLTY
jgi:hypothetical protein